MWLTENILALSYEKNFPKYGISAGKLQIIYIFIIERIQ